jgi:multicomponent Na+:H+ antiporter subunit D
MIYFLNPGLLLIVFAILANFKKACQNYVYLLAPILGIVIMIAISVNLHTNTISLPLHLDKYQLIFTISILIVLLANNIFTINHSNASPKDLQLSLIYSGATICIILSQHLIFIFLSLELMMLAGTALIFNGHTTKSEEAGMSYLTIHIVSGTFFLIGIIMATEGHLIIQTHPPYNLTLSHTCILIALLINIALPPFSYWLTRGYLEASPSGNTILSIGMTKISAMLIAKIFLGYNFLIYLGIFMGAYGIVYMLLETNIRKIVAFSIISETGIILIAIGIGNFKVAMSLIISNVFYVSLLLMCISNIDLVTNAKHYFNIKKMPQKNIILTAFILASLSMSSFPLTSGYFNKYELTHTIALLNKSWLVIVLNILNAGIIFTVLFKTISFIFFYNKKIENIQSTSNIGLSLLMISATLCCFAMPFFLDTSLTLDIKIAVQFLLFVVIFLFFIILQRYFFFKTNTTLIELDLICRHILSSLYSNFIRAFKYIYVHTWRLANLGFFKTKFLHAHLSLSYSRYLSNTIILTILLLIFFLIA